MENRPDPPARGPRTSLVEARGDSFRIVRLLGTLFVCSRANGNCCCGWEEKGRMPFDNDLWGDEWERRRIRNRVHLSFTGCLGPCATGNNALLQLYGQSVWLKDLNEPDLPVAVFDWIEAMLAAGGITAPPDRLRGHLFDRFLPPADDGPPVLDLLDVSAGNAAGDDDGLDRLDAVCLMDVDPETARHTADYGGRRFVFCAPACRKQFLADPAAYLG